MATFRPTQEPISPTHCTKPSAFARTMKLSLRNRWKIFLRLQNADDIVHFLKLKMPGRIVVFQRFSGHFAYLSVKREIYNYFFALFCLEMAVCIKKLSEFCIQPPIILTLFVLFSIFIRSKHVEKVKNSCFFIPFQRFFISQSSFVIICHFLGGSYGKTRTMGN